MRKLRTTKKNPNPPWPNSQPVVIIPPGSNATSVGLSKEPVRESVDFESAISSTTTQETFVENERENRRDPIMGNMSPIQLTPQMMQNSEKSCSVSDVSAYLCTYRGQNAKIEFLFGENVHMEKYGVIRQVGKDFIAIEENGTGNTVVCSICNIKFINIFN